MACTSSTLHFPQQEPRMRTMDFVSVETKVCPACRKCEFDEPESRLSADGPAAKTGEACFTIGCDFTLTPVSLATSETSWPLRRKSPGISIIRSRPIPDCSSAEEGQRWQ